MFFYPEKSTAYFECFFEEYRHYNFFYWSKESNLYEDENDKIRQKNRKIQMNSNFTNIMRIENITFEDVGKYYCTAKDNDFDYLLNGSVSLQILNIDNSFIIDDDYDDSNTKLGQLPEKNQPTLGTTTIKVDTSDQSLSSKESPSVLFVILTIIITVIIIMLTTLIVFTVFKYLKNHKRTKIIELRERSIDLRGDQAFIVSYFSYNLNLELIIYFILTLFKVFSE